MDWETVKFTVGLHSVAHPIAFYSSTEYWHTQRLPPENTWHLETDGDLTETTVVENSNAKIAVKGDCLSDISIPNGGLVHIHGSMKGKLTIGGHSEVVIGGDLAGAIEGSGISQVFLGRDATGSVHHTDSLSLWIEGTCSAEVLTGTPRTNLYVRGDFIGSARPASEAALLYLVVRGYVSYSTLMNIAKNGYTQFKSSAGCSDCSPGYHPDEKKFVELGIKHRPMWLIHSFRDSSANGTLK